MRLPTNQNTNFDDFEEMVSCEMMMVVSCEMMMRVVVENFQCFLTEMVHHFHHLFDQIEMVDHEMVDCEMMVDFLLLPSTKINLLIKHF